MKQIKLSVLGLCMLLSSNTLWAQETAIHEFGIQLSSLQAFSAIYKKERDLNKYVRVQVGTGNYTRTYIKDKDPLKQLSINFSCGVEKRKPLGPKTNFVHGFAPTISILSRTDPTSKLSRSQLGIAYILGVQYIINDRFYVSLESLPSVSGFISKNSNSDSQAGINIGFYNNIANITLAHSFSRTQKRASN